MKKFLPLIILFVSLILRVNQLNTIPVGMTDDEVRLVYSSYSIWHTGRDVVHGIVLPFSFVLHNWSFTPVSVYITAPFVGLMGLSPMSARLPFALAGVGVVFLTYLLVKRLLANSAVAALSAAVLSVNVWAIQLSRMAYEAGFALLFYLWGTYLFLGDWKKQPLRSVLGAMAVFFLAFNSYNGMKLVYLPILLVLVWYRKKEFVAKRQLVTALIGSVMVTFGVFLYFTVAQGAGAHGGAIVIFQDVASAAKSVELARRASSAPHLLQVLYHNKVTYFVDQVSRHYLYAFSPDFLFLSQEGSGIFSLWSRGNLYLIELPFLCIGLVSLCISRRKLFLLLGMMLLIAALPSGLGPESFIYATRASFMLPWLALCIGVGIFTIVKKSRILAAVIAVMYVYFIAGYLTQYYFEWPRYSAASYSKDQKDLATFMMSYSDTGEKFLITNASDMFFLQYAFYTRMDPRLVQEAYRKSPVLAQLGSIRIVSSCIAPKNQDPRPRIPQGTLFINKSCYTKNPDFVISFPDGTPVWYVYRSPFPVEKPVTP